MGRKKVKVLLSRRAQRDLDEIYRYLSERSSVALEKVDHKIFQSLKRLQEMPLSGHEVRELSGRKYRETLAYHYRIIYRYLESKGTVRILTIHHGRRFLSPALFQG